MRILDRKTEYSTPWFSVVAKKVESEPAPYYSLRMQDYVTNVAFTTESELILVRQFRPAVERYTLELPSGHVEKNESPAVSAARELAEECGFEARRVELLGTLISDTGRNENRLWCYLATGVIPQGQGYVPEPGVERMLVPRARVPELFSHPEFDHALHLAALMLAVAKHGAGFLALH